MAFTPILTDQPISYARNRSAYHNGPRESSWGFPVYFSPQDFLVGQYGYPGPRYKEGYTYDNCPAPENNYNGNCTWWCWGRLYDTMGVYLPNMGDAKYWYDRYSGSRDTDASNIQPGDIIVLEDSGPGHVMFVEQVSGNTIYISQSAYSTRSVWVGMACLVTSYSKSEIVAGRTVDMYRNIDSPYYETVVGVIHTGGVGPSPTTDLEITITPASYNVTMSALQDFVDFQYAITITGIPAGQSVSGGNTYPGLSRVYNTGWSYTDYSVSGTVYRRATKIQTLRYTREHSYAYSTVKHMYFNLSFSTGTIDTDTPMTINVQAAQNKRLISLIAARIRRRGGRINVTQI